MKTLGIVIATPGRRSLGRTLSSIFYQCKGIEDVLVVGDGFDRPTKELVGFFAEHGLPARYVATRKTRDWGHSQLNYGLQEVRGDYVTYQDDDDIYLPRALEEMVRLVSAQPIARPLIGRVKTPQFGLLWQRPDVSSCLDGHCLVVPNEKRKLGWFASLHRGDQGFLHTTLRNYQEWAWTDRVWTLTRPTWTMDTILIGHAGDVWGWEFIDTIDGLASARLRLSKDLDHDRMFARLTWRRRDLLQAEYLQIVQFALYACQGNDCWFQFDEANDAAILRSALIESNYKEHNSTEYTHDWPPDFWPEVPSIEYFINPETNERMTDYRDDVWGGKPVL